MQGDSTDKGLDDFQRMLRQEMHTMERLAKRMTSDPRSSILARVVEKLGEAIKIIDEKNA